MFRRLFRTEICCGRFQTLRVWLISGFPCRDAAGAQASARFNVRIEGRVQNFLARWRCVRRSGVNAALRLIAGTGAQIFFQPGVGAGKGGGGQFEKSGT